MIAVHPSRGLRRFVQCLRLVVLALSVLVIAQLANAQSVTLHARAGLGGQVRPGRWAPVSVEITSASGPISGQLTVEWGDARVSRDLELSAGIARQVDLYVRSADPRDVIAVRFRSADATLASIDVPVHIVPFDAGSFVLCGASGAASSPAPCSATVDSNSFPRSWRGLDAVDSIVLSGADVQSHDRIQGRAAMLATALARLNETGRGVPVLAEVPASRRFPRYSSFALGVYVSVLVAVVAVSQWRRSALMMLGLMAAAAAVGSVAVYASGHIGPDSSVLVHHATSIDQYEGSDGALVTMRAVAEFPAFDTYVLRADLDDGEIARPAGQGVATVRFDGSGTPILDGTYSAGRLQPFAFVASSPSALLRGERVGDSVRVTNTSSLTLRDCVFPGTASGQGSLAAGEATTVTLQDEDDDPAVRCAADRSPWGFSDATHDLEMDGVTSVVLHLKPDHAAAGSNR